MEFNLTPSSDYDQKFATTVAGNKLTDVFQVGGIAEKPQLLAAKAVDLTPHLSGNNIKKYPFLANLSESSWNSAIFNGKIYGILIPWGAISSQALYARKDILDDQGLPAEVKDAAEFTEPCKALTDERKNRFALAGVPTQFIRNMWAIPNGWRIQGDKLVSNLEDPAQLDVLTLLAQLWKSGCIRPDAFTGQDTDLTARFGNATSPLVGDTFSGWAGYLQVMEKQAEIAFIAPPSHGGSGSEGPGWAHQPSPSPPSARTPRTDRDAAGLPQLPGHPVRDQVITCSASTGSRVSTTTHSTPAPRCPKHKGKSELGVLVGYQADGPSTIFLPDREGSTQACFDAMKKIVPEALENPVAGTYPETDNRKGAQINGVLNDATNDIIQGRQPVSAWEPAAKKWKSAGVVTRPPRSRTRPARPLTDHEHGAPDRRWCVLRKGS